MIPINYEAYRFFREQAHSPANALLLARAERRAEERGIDILWQDDDIPWDGDCPAPEYLLWGCVFKTSDIDMRRGTHRAGAEFLATLGSVGVNSMRDPYLRVCAAELFVEALEVLDKEDACIAERDYAGRATFAMNGV